MHLTMTKLNLTKPINAFHLSLKQQSYCQRSFQTKFIPVYPKYRKLISTYAFTITDTNLAGKT